MALKESRRELYARGTSRFNCCRAIYWRSGLHQLGRTTSALAVGRPRATCKRGFAIQATLAILGFLLGLIAWWQSGQFLWLIGAVLMIANWPYTLLGIMPTNSRLLAIDPKNSDPSSRALIERWGWLHAGRSALGASATLIFLAALHA